MKSNTLIVTILFLLAVNAPSFGQLREYPDESLKGVKAVRVVVKYEGPVEASYGLSQQELQKAVELRLKADDIKILTDKEWNAEPGKPYFSVNVVGTQAGTDKAPVFFYSFATDLIQQVRLDRKPSFRTDGSTWNQDYAMVVEKDNLREVTLKISDVAHDFAQSVHDANK